MSKLNIVDNFSMQLSGNTWRFNESNYTFLPDVSDNIDKVESNLIIESLRYKTIIEKYSITTDGQSCYLTFLFQQFKILYIDNSSDPHLMKLENQIGNFLTFKSSPVMHQ